MFGLFQPAEYKAELLKNQLWIELTVMISEIVLQICYPWRCLSNTSLITIPQAQGEGSPLWVSGFCLAAASLCCPDTFTLWPALLAAIPQRSKEGQVKWKEIQGWGAISAMTACIGPGLHLYYNFPEFGNFLDFGYVTGKGGAYLLQKNARIWALQSPFHSG
jgi:hypothetical protein